MKIRRNGSWPTLAVVLLGMIAFKLRQQLYLTAVDDRNLLLRGTPLEIGLLLLTAAVLGCLLLTLRKSVRPEGYYRAGVLAALGHVVMALGILYTVLTGLPSLVGYLGKAWQLLGLAAPVCLLVAGGMRLFGKQPFFLLHVVPCLFLLVQVVNNYQLWSSDPQLQNYLFALLATLALALFSYYTAAFEADSGSCRMVRFSGLAAVYLCLAELGWTSEPLLYLGGMLWALTGMCTPAAAGKD